MANQSKTKKIIKEFLKKFLEEHAKDNLKVEGILVAGSFLDNKKISKNSDLDLFIVIKSHKKRYRGMDIVDGLSIDYFINPIEQLRYDMSQIKDSSNNTLSNAIAYGHIIQDKNKNLLKLQQQARKIIKNTIENPLPDFRITLIKYTIDDYLKDIEDNYIDKDYFAWQYNLSLLQNYLVEVFCRANKIPLVKPKYQRREINKKHRRFVWLYQRLSMSSDQRQKMDNIKKLSKYVLDNLGGKLPRKWEIKSKSR